MINYFSLKIITPEKIAFQHDKVRSVHFKTGVGKITLLANHAPIIARITSDTIEIELSDVNSKSVLNLSGGTIEFSQNSCTVLTVNAS